MDIKLKSGEKKYILGWIGVFLIFAFVRVFSTPGSGLNDWTASIFLYGFALFGCLIVHTIGWVVGKVIQGNAARVPEGYPTPMYARIYSWLRTDDRV